MLDLHRLRLLRELKHRGTLSAVATALQYSPSVISQHLSVLEREAGTPLLDHVGRRVKLTAQAELLVAHTEIILAQLELAESDLAASLAGVTGTVRIASFQTAALGLIPTVLKDLRTRHPQLRAELLLTEPTHSLPALQTRDFDLVIAEELPGRPLPRAPHLEDRDLCTDRLRLAVQVGTGAVRLSDHALSPWVMEAPGNPARDWAVARCRSAGFEPDVRYEATDLVVHQRLIEQGLAVGFLPDLLWLGRQITVALEADESSPMRSIVTVTRKGAGQHPAVQACREALARAAGTTQAGDREKP